MGRKRKVPVVDEEKENEDSRVTQTQLQHNSSSASNSTTLLHQGPMYTIMSNVQLNETFHKKYIKEMQQLYAKMDHDAFSFTFIKMLKSAMEADEGNDYANTTLLFCAKFVSSYDSEDTHPILVDISKWLLTTISNNPHIRFRLCQFVNMILNALGAEAALDDCICDNIMEYMLARLRDVSPSVRVQAILALQRLQVPDNPDDPVLRAYQFHLCSDPSPRVRQAVITSMGRNYNTIPYILDRLWDVDEKVRRHTYLHMSSYPVKSYKVSQRLTLMEQGLNDRSDMVRKVVITIMLKQWIESYQKNLILLVSGLKLDSSDVEIDRFRKIAKLTLKEIFKHQSMDDIIACLPLEEEGEFHKCVLHEKLTIELSLYWQCLTEHLQDGTSAEDLERILPELSAFCTYIEHYCQSHKGPLDKFEQMEFQYILLSLMEILYTFDLGDEIGRDNLKKLLTTILKNYTLDEKIIEVIVKCAENLISNKMERLQYFVDIIQETCELNSKQNDLIHDRSLISDLMRRSSDASLNLKLSSLKVKILDLEEQEMICHQRKDYVNAHKIEEEKNACTEEYTNLLKPLLEIHSPSLQQQPKKVTHETILKCLQLAYYMVASRHVSSLTPNVCKLYNDFICRHLASNQIAIRDWALRCGTAFSMLYEALSKDVFEELYSQFYKNHNIRIWKTSIACIFELLDRYGMDSLVVQEQPNKSKKGGRQLYNTVEFLDNDEENSTTAAVYQGVDVTFMMSHFLDTCDDICITSAIVNGFCRLVLRGHIKSIEIIEKLLLRYFNPTTDDEINQILGVFLENLIQRKKQDLLYPCLLPTVSTVMKAPYDSPLQEIKPENIMRFIIDATRQEFCASNTNIHNKLATLFLNEMQNNADNKELCKLLAKEIVSLEVNVLDNLTLKNELKEIADKLLKTDFDPKTMKHIVDFKGMLDGVFNPPLMVIENASDDEDKSDDETVTNTAASATTDPLTTTTTTNSTAATNSDTVVEQDKTMVEEAAAAGTDTASATAAASNETQTSACTESQPEDELLKTPPRNKVQPSPPTSTRFGRDNMPGLRYIRKSLNITRSTESYTTAGEDGPSRPPKIRIEARIDSDKKAPPSSPDMVKKPAENARVRRNLRRNAGKTPSGEQLQDATTESDDVEQQRPDIEVLATALPLEITPQTSANSVELAAAATKSTASRIAKVSSKSSVTQKPETPTRATRSRTAPVSAQKPNEKRTATPANSDDDDEIIPPSPSAEETRSNTTTRLRRMQAESNVTLRSRRANNTSTAPAATSSPKNSTLAITSSDVNGVAAASSSSTPLRNGRKRILHISPKSTTLLFAADACALSPLRKQSRVDNTVVLATSTTEPTAKEQAPAPATDATNSNSTIPADVDSSPSSTKENDNVVLAPQQSKASIKQKLSEKDIKRAASQTTEANALPSRTSSNNKSLQSQNTGGSSGQLRRPTGDADVIENVGHTSDSSISTRKQSQARIIMTRKRLSLEHQPIVNSSSLNSLTSAAGGASKLRLPSKIPVSTLKLRSKTSSTSVQSGDNLSTASSGAESSSNERPSSRRKELTTKMTRINLAPSNAGPVAMRLARPRRAETPSTEIVGPSRISKRRHI